MGTTPGSLHASTDELSFSAAGPTVVGGPSMPGMHGVNVGVGGRGGGGVSPHVPHLTLSAANDINVNVNVHQQIFLGYDSSHTLSRPCHRL